MDLRAAFCATFRGACGKALTAHRTSRQIMTIAVVLAGAAGIPLSPSEAQERTAQPATTPKIAPTGQQRASLGAGKSPSGFETRAILAALKSGPRVISKTCAVETNIYDGRAALRKVYSRIGNGEPFKLLAIGSSSTVGVGASSVQRAYPDRLKKALKTRIPDLHVSLVKRGLSGEVASGTARRIKLEVVRNKPDLVIWQVGTNDAIARIPITHFTDLLRQTVRWVRRQNADIVLIDPQYVRRLAKDRHYGSIVKAIARIAGEEQILLINRYDTMRDLATRIGEDELLAKDRFHLNDRGYRCLAEYAARTIVSGLSEANAAVMKAERRDRKNRSGSPSTVAE